MVVLDVPEVFRLTVPPLIVSPAVPVISPEEVNVPAPARFAPLAVRAVVPPGARIILPVPTAPRVRD